MCVNKSDKQVKPVTVERIEQMFARGKIYNVIGLYIPGNPFPEIGSDMSLQYDPGQPVPYIRWQGKQVEVFVGIVNNKVEYRYGRNHEPDYDRCPVTTDQQQIETINRLFDFWYQYMMKP